MVARLIEHNENLETENQLIIEIKQKYALDLSKLRIDLDTLRTTNDRIIK